MHCHILVIILRFLLLLPMRNPPTCRTGAVLIVTLAVLVPEAVAPWFGRKSTAKIAPVNTESAPPVVVDATLVNGGWEEWLKRVDQIDENAKSRGFTGLFKARKVRDYSPVWAAIDAVLAGLPLKADDVTCGDCRGSASRLVAQVRALPKAKHNVVKCVVGLLALATTHMTEMANCAAVAKHVERAIALLKRTRAEVGTDRANAGRTQTTEPVRPPAMWAFAMGEIVEMIHIDLFFAGHVVRYLTAVAAAEGTSGFAMHHALVDVQSSLVWEAKRGDGAPPCPFSQIPIDAYRCINRHTAWDWGPYPAEVAVQNLFVLRKHAATALNNADETGQVSGPVVANFCSDDAIKNARESLITAITTMPYDSSEFLTATLHARLVAEGLTTAPTPPPTRPVPVARHWNDPPPAYANSKARRAYERRNMGR